MINFQELGIREQREFKRKLRKIFEKHFEQFLVDYEQMEDLFDKDIQVFIRVADPKYYLNFVWDKKKTDKAIKSFVGSWETVIESFGAFPPVLARRFEESFRENMDLFIPNENIPHRLNNTPVPLIRHNLSVAGQRQGFRDLLKIMDDLLNGRSPSVKTNNSTKGRGHKILDDISRGSFPLKHISEKQSSKKWSKILVVDTARDVWKRNTQSEAPKTLVDGSNEDFRDYLEDIFAALEISADPRTAVRSWRRMFHP